MEFMQSGPDIIRSDTQRWLLDYWVCQRGNGRLPVWRDLAVAELAVPFDNLAWADVVETSDGARFRIGFHGTRLAESLGPVDCIGKFLDDFLPPTYLGSAIATYRRSATDKVPVYTVSDMRDPLGRIVHHERLLLPFTLDGHETARILASIEAASPEGPVELRDLMRSPIRPPVIALCTTIQY